MPGASSNHFVAAIPGPLSLIIKSCKDSTDVVEKNLHGSLA